MYKVPQKKTVSVNFICALFSLLFTHDKLAMQAMAWRFICEFKTTSHIEGPNLREKHLAFVYIR